MNGRSHPNANGLYNKPFPHFEELGIAFGRDRAQGGNAENITQAVATMEAEREATLSDRQVNENTQVNLEETEMEYEADSQEPPTPGVPAAPGASAAPSSSAAPSASYIERNKRKRGSKSKEVIDIVLIKNTAILVDLVSCFKHEKEGVERRMKLMALLRDVPGLSGDDRMKAGLSILSRGWKQARPGQALLLTGLACHVVDWPEPGLQTTIGFFQNTKTGLLFNLAWPEAC
ncbi:hypothetical protein Ahy_B02g058696 [Arachis hypogaea]|uniref:Uncharacterized protein n=1 Tax=Arachis hypogaea TaxID=3818 RepID=A0A445AF55_ARAHY|nr:hypothetical protein Ahy_B02g058696 [Arachis hypogaea]